MSDHDELVDLRHRRDEDEFTIEKLRNELTQAQANLAAAQERTSESDSLLASATDLVNSWAREMGVQEAHDEKDIKGVTDRLWSELSRRLFAPDERVAAARAQALEEAAKIVQAKSELFILIGDENQALDALAWSASAIRALITPSDSTALAKLLAEQRLALIESFGLMLADAEISCGQKHSAQFSALSKLRDIALAARVAELKGEQHVHKE